MKILIVMSGGFDTYGPSRHLYKALIEDLLRSGNIVHLIESHSSGNDPDVPSSIAHNPLFSYELVQGKIVKKRAFIRRYLAGLKYTHDCRHSLEKAKGMYDVALVQSCVWAPFMVPLVKKKTKAITFWNIQDMFPGASIANGVMRNRLLIKAFYWLHKRAYKFADYITVISEDMRDKVIQQGYDKDKIHIIYDWFDDSTIEEVEWEHNLFAQKYNMSKEIFYVQFAGTMGFNFDYNLVIKTALLLKERTNIVFQMVGFGSQLDVFKKEVKDKKLENVVFLPLQEQNMVKHVYSACSACIIPLPFGVIGNSVPSKIALLMACKRPIITTADKDSKYLAMVNDNEFGFGYGPDEHKKVAEAIVELSKNKQLCIEMGNNGYNYGHKLYSRTHNTDKYIKLFEKAIKENKVDKKAKT